MTTRELPLVISKLHGIMQTPRFSPKNTLDITTEMLVKEASFCSFAHSLGLTRFGWEQCWIRNTFSVATFWSSRWNLRWDRPAFVDFGYWAAHETMQAGKQIVLQP